MVVTEDPHFVAIAAFSTHQCCFPATSNISKWHFPAPNNGTNQHQQTLYGTFQHQTMEFPNSKELLVLDNAIGAGQCHSLVLDCVIVTNSKSAIAMQISVCRRSQLVVSKALYVGWCWKAPLCLVLEGAIKCSGAG